MRACSGGMAYSPLHASCGTLSSHLTVPAVFDNTRYDVMRPRYDPMHVHGNPAWRLEGCIEGVKGQHGLSRWPGVAIPPPVHFEGLFIRVGEARLTHPLRVSDRVSPDTSAIRRSPKIALQNTGLATAFNRQPVEPQPMALNPALMQRLFSRASSSPLPGLQRSLHHPVQGSLARFCSAPSTLCPVHTAAAGARRINTPENMNVKVE